uniref:Reverse transcriptase domain-containing protein n=1 Tax=Panagrolaimus davidi TaxID=227884 RepID=A0A914QHJ3_9BILA
MKIKGYVMLLVERAVEEQAIKEVLKVLADSAKEKLPSRRMQSPSRQMININLNSSNEFQEVDEDRIVEPTVKRTRGPAAIYVSLEVVESLAEAKLKAKDKGLKL